MANLNPNGNGNGHGWMMTKAALVRWVATIGGIVVVVDGLNNFSLATSLLPFETKSGADAKIQLAQVETNKKLDGIDDKQDKTQSLILDLTIQLLDGQVYARQGELSDAIRRLASGAVTSQEVENIKNIIKQLSDKRAALDCLRDQVNGYNRICR